MSGCVTLSGGRVCRRPWREEDRDAAKRLADLPDVPTVTEPSRSSQA